MKVFNKLQKVGKALMLPIAVLPVAGLLLRLGQPDLLNLEWVAGAGSAIFGNLAIIFAIGVAVGLAKENHGAAALAGAVGYFILTAVTEAINPDINMATLGGILSGIVAGLLYNRFHETKLPDFLGFFGGKRFVPIITGGTMLVLGGLFGLIWPPIQDGINAFGNWMTTAGAPGMFVYGTTNRLLIPVGLHHVLNTLGWFVFGTFEAGGEIITGDLNRFFAGDPSAGRFMAGFFPVMMFGLPAAALAMLTAAKKANKKRVAGMLISIALTSFLTGITEPIEFAFMFLAPILYLFHAVFTGISLALTEILNIKHGFTFSAGLIDYILNMKYATNGWLLLPIGAAVGALYYFVFLFAIKTFNLPTPGRTDDTEEADVSEGGKSKYDELALKYLDIFGRANLENIDACITRLRLEVKGHDMVTDAQLKALGAKGVIRPSKQSIQVVLGPDAEIIAGKMKQIVNKELVSSN